MDGVIIDSELHWKKAELSLFKSLLHKWTEEDQHKILGMNMHEIYRLMANEYGLEITHAEYMRRVNGVAIDVYTKRCNLIDGFLDLVKRLKNDKIPIAIASSSLNDWINIVLDKFELRNFFDVIVSSEDIGNKGKPAPDIYLYTAKKLQTDPKDCIAIEYSENGVLSAKNAGMYCVGFRNGFNDMQDLSAADVIIEGFKNFDLSIF